MRGTVFIGVEKNGKPWIESPPLHIKSEDALIHSCIIQIAESFGSRIIAIDAPLSRPKHGTMRDAKDGFGNMESPAIPLARNG